MATAYTGLTGEETKGEREVYESFMLHLPDDYDLWHCVTLPSNGPETDIILIHPKYGILIFEIKDWSLSQIKSISINGWLVESGGKVVNFRDPTRQADASLFHIKELLQRKPEYVHQAGPHQGKLSIPLNAYAIFSNIYSQEIRNLANSEYLLNNRYLFRDQIIEPNDPQLIQKTIIRQRKIAFSFQCDGNTYLDLKNVVFPQLGIPSIGEVPQYQLDNYQNRLVGRASKEALLIEGAVGTGKSIILAKIAGEKHRSNPQSKILLICFNRAMASQLKVLLKSDAKSLDYEITDSIEVTDFSEWLKLNKYVFYWRVDYNKRWVDENAKEALERYKINQVTLPSYDSIVIDEGQDFTPAMINLLFMSLTDPQGFVMAFDKNQILYTDSWCENHDKISVRLPSSSELLRQYRTAPDLLRLAIVFNARLKQIPYDSEQLRKVLDIKIFARIYDWFLRNKPPESSFYLRGFKDIDNIANDIALEIKSRRKSNNQKWSDFLIILFQESYWVSDSASKYVSPIIETVLSKYEIPTRYIGKRGDEDLRSFSDEDAVKIMNIFQAKGFEAQSTFLIGLDQVNSMRSIHDHSEHDKLRHKSNIAYVAFTRAASELFVYYSEITEEISLLADCASKVFSFKFDLSLED